MNRKLYVITAIRWTGFHSMVIGVTNLKHQAIKKAEEYRIYRGGNKYFTEVTEVKDDEVKVIYNNFDLWKQDAKQMGYDSTFIPDVVKFE